jgi:hypothetical protein
MISAKETAGVHAAGRAAGSWIAELLVSSTHWAGLLCPLCCRTAQNTMWRAMWPGDTICEACWGKHN